MESVKPPFFVSRDDPPARRAILNAALHLFVEHGIDGTTIRMIAEASGFTNPALFRHFATKEELARYLYAASYGHLAEMVGEGGGEGFAARFEQTIRSYLRAYDRAPDTVLYVHDYLRRFRGQIATEPGQVSLMGSMLALLRLGKEEGAVAHGLEMQLAAGAVIGVLAQVARMHYFGSFRGSAEEMTDEIVAMTRRMLAG